VHLVSAWSMHARCPTGAAVSVQLAQADVASVARSVAAVPVAAEPVHAAVPSAAGAASDSLAPAKPARLLFAPVVSGAHPVDDRSLTSCIHLRRRQAISSKLLFAPVVSGAHSVDDRSLTSCIHLCRRQAISSVPSVTAAPSPSHPSLHPKLPRMTFRLMPG
jgi:hypothetical protein